MKKVSSSSGARGGLSIIIAAAQYQVKKNPINIKKTATGNNTTENTSFVNTHAAATILIASYNTSAQHLITHRRIPPNPSNINPVSRSETQLREYSGKNIK
jgi:hypothetical protein